MPLYYNARRTRFNLTCTKSKDSVTRRFMKFLCVLVQAVTPVRTIILFVIALLLLKFDVIHSSSLTITTISLALSPVHDLSSSIARTL